MTKVYDVAIVGAGPAGLMAAITAAQDGLRVLVLEGQEKLGAKLLLSGGGRCNITNLRVSEKDYQSGYPRTVRNILRTFPPERVRAFFRELGVEMILEEGAKFFPKAQSAKAVLQALLQKAENLPVAIETGKKVATIYFASGFFHLNTGEKEYLSKTVVICTGGLSYPATGSNGSGYHLAKIFGHSIIPTTPALVPLLTDDPEWKGLAGITVPVRLSLRNDGETAAMSGGAMLFTHFGFSGPAILDISGAWLRFSLKRKQLWADFLPGISGEDFLKKLTHAVVVHPRRSWKRFFSQYFPERLTEILLKKTGIHSATHISQSSREQRQSVAHQIKHFDLRVSGSLGYEKAEVTAGGVNLQEVDSKTLESQLQSGIFFAGEVLDVDGRIGGFNFQWAWASGFTVGKAIRRNLRHQGGEPSGR